GEGTCRRDDVALRVAAVHANGVELHELATVIFVETPGTGGSSLRLPGEGACGSALWEPASGTEARRLRKSGTSTCPAARHRGQRRLVRVGRAFPIVQVVEHRRALRDGLEQVAEFAQCVR